MIQSPSPLVIGPLTRTDFVRYQGASGDMNPVHHDEPFAIAAGYPSPLGVGMFPAGVMAAWVAAWLGPEKIRSVKVRWKSPVFAGDTLHFSARVVDETPDQIKVEMTCVKQDGTTAVEGWATFAT